MVSVEFFRKVEREDEICKLCLLTEVFESHIFLLQRNFGKESATEISSTGIIY